MRTLLKMTLLYLVVMACQPVFASPLMVLGTQGKISVVSHPSLQKNNATIPSIQPFLPISQLASLAPTSSDMTVGQVIPHPTNNNSPWRTALFIVGNDDVSKAWLQKNSEYLQHIQAIGIGTGFKNQNQLHYWVQQFHVPLIPAELSGFSHLMNEYHYPLLITKGWVTQ